MSDHTLDRIGGSVLAIGAAASTVGYIIDSFDQPNGPITSALVDSPIYTLSALLVFFGSGLTLVGLTAFVARQFRRSPVLTVAGAAGISLVLLIQGIGNWFVNATIFPALIDSPAARGLANGPAPALMGVLFLIGVAGWVVGGPLLAISVLRAKVFSRWIGVVLLVGAAVGIAAFALPHQFESIGAIIAGVALFGLGAQLVAPAAQPVSGAPVAAPAV
jgi:hypothetical protein